tara:strand:+ start:535 stop:702 length:168 start_codon:yes stop_codon:yes gene_type:complete
MSLNIIQSANFAFIGLLKAAGLFFSKKWCPDHANGYIIKGAKINNFKLNIKHQIT